MSLRVWLPLNGDLHNQGLSGLTATNNGATVNNNGKIGKCYLFGTAASDISLPAAAMNSYTTECSVSFWINILTWNTNYATFFLAGPAGTAWKTYIFGFLRNNAASTCCFTISNGSSASNTSYLTSALDLNKWYHISLVYKTGHCLIYINGSLYEDYTTNIVPNFTNITTIKIGQANSGNSYLTNCLMNDFRIYDHALSAAEVAEIAKGLVLHYKLDNDGWIFPNLITKSSYETEVWTNNNTDLSYVYDEDKGYKVKRLLPAGLHQKTNKADGPLLDLFGLSNYKTNTQYTISFDMKEIRTDNKKTTLYITFLYTDNSLSSIITNTINFNQWTHFSLTSTANKTVSRIKSTYGNGGYFLLDNIRLVESSIEKDGYIPADEISNIIYDCSGYGNNGTIIGTVNAVAGSPRYDIATSMNNTSTSNHIEANVINIPDNIFTVSLWVKSTKSKNQVLFADPQIVIGLLNSLIYVCRTSAKGFATSHFLDGQWNHIVATRNGNTYLVYINGELEAQNGGNNNYVHNASTLWLFNRSYNNSYAANTTMSDIRVYATILSAAAIQELYKTSMLVDASGNIAPRGVNEI